MGNLETYITEIAENLPEHILKKYNFISRKDAFYKIHFPKNSHDIDLAKYRLAYEELYAINYTAISSKHQRFDASEGRALPIPLDAELVKEVMAKLPFELTGGQKIALFQVLKDMEKNHSMQRLLEGDVGTGKTIVALIATIHAIKQSEKLQVSGLNSVTQLQPSHLNSLSQGEKEATEYVQKKFNPQYITELAKNLRRFSTEAESILWEILQNRKFRDLKFRRQHPIGRYIADFYCHEIKLVIELDGKIHENQKEYDEIRDEFLKS